MLSAYSMWMPWLSNSSSNSLSSPALCVCMIFCLNHWKSKTIPEPMSAEENPNWMCPFLNMVLFISSMTASSMAVSEFRFLAFRCVCMAFAPWDTALFSSYK